MKRCPTFHYCRIFDFNVFSYELENFEMAQLSSNMKKVLSLTCHWDYYCQYFWNTKLTSFSSSMKWCFPSFVSKILVFHIFHYLSTNWKWPLPAASWRGVKLSFLLWFSSPVIWQYICIVENCPFSCNMNWRPLLFASFKCNRWSETFMNSYCKFFFNFK